MAGPELDKSSAGFVDLPWEDVIFSRIFSYLSVADIFRCRRISKTFNELCLNFFKCCRCLDCCAVANRITEAAFIRITVEAGHLRILILENCKHIVKDATLVELLRRNPQLTCLNISGCNSLSNQCLVSIGQSCPKLTKIYLRECRWVSPQSVINLALSCKALEVADFSGCWEVNDECITVLIKSCPGITQLSVNGCYGITDLSLNVASHHLPKLTSLGLDGCWRITNHAIRLVGEYCRSLKYLKVKDCRDISEASLARLRVKGVDINVEPTVFTSSVLSEIVSQPALHMAPFIRFNPS